MTSQTVVNKKKSSGVHRRNNIEKIYLFTWIILKWTAERKQTSFIGHLPEKERKIKY